MRYRLRTLLILLAVLPPLLWFGWTKYEAWRMEQARQRAVAAQQARLKEMMLEYLIGAPVKRSAANAPLPP
jgi:hypothetical protein